MIKFDNQVVLGVTIRVNAVAAGPTESDFLSERMKLSAEQIQSTLSGV